MKTRFLRGTTDENNGLTLPDGEFSVDLERKAVRVHDGQTLGGWELVGTPAIKLPLGPKELIAGSSSQGFFGETMPSDFITYESLATELGLSAGVSQYNEESIWLKCMLDNRTLYVAKKPARNTISWNDINNRNLVYGTRTVTIDGFNFKVRLIKGASSDPTDTPLGYDVAGSYGSEWNRLMYPLHSGVHTNVSNPATHSDPNADPFGAWASYSDLDLGVGDNTPYTICQEVHTGRISGRVARGLSGVTRLLNDSSTGSQYLVAWRPVLELVE